MGVVSGALEAGLPGEDSERGHKDAAKCTGGLGVVEADAVALGQGVRVVSPAGGHEAFARRAVEGAVLAFSNTYLRRC